MTRELKVYGLLLLMLLAANTLSVAVGTCGVAFVDHWYNLGLPRLVMSMLAGASLAVAGAMFQSLFRNPLASPYTLGVSSGASLGAAIVFLFAGTGLWWGLPKLGVAALAGSLLCVTVVYLVANLREGQSIATLLLAGITIGFICSALLVLMLYLADAHDLEAIVNWMMGSLQLRPGPDPVLEAITMASLAGGVAIYAHRDLDLLMMGETIAAARGVDVRRTRFMVYFAASLLTASVVAQCGPIGFVGLIIPHTMRLLVRPTHRHLLPACALAGASFLPLCDVLARNTMWWLRDESRQVPVGVLTNLIGGGFFLYLLLSRRRQGLLS